MEQRGTPYKLPTDVKSERLRVKVTGGDKRRIEQWARAQGMTVSLAVLRSIFRDVEAWEATQR